MRSFLITILIGCFYYSGLVKIALWRQRRSSPRVLVLNYHRALGGDLRRHLLFLRRHFRVLHLEEALEELYSHAENKKSYHSGISIVLTFDDGHCDNYTHSFALAQELHMPFAVFLPPNYIENGDNYWWLEGERLVRHAQVDKVIVDEEIYHLKDEKDRKAIVKVIFTHLRNAKSVADREGFLSDMHTALAVTASYTPEEELMLPMTWEQIYEMDDSGLVTFGAHTMHHPVLSCLEDPSEVQYEVQECRNVLEQKLGHPVRFFAYPIGKPQDIGDEALRAVQEAGYSWAFTTVSGVNTPQSNPYELLRVPIDVSQHWLFLAALVSGVWQFFSPLWAKL
jgi:peptidoglycan/xylan/chitin deacetylase (PgdA/CDA1 family)